MLGTVQKMASASRTYSFSRRGYSPNSLVRMVKSSFGLEVRRSAQRGLV